MTTADEGSPTKGATRADRLEGLLRDLLEQAPDLEAAAVVSVDGLPMSSALPVGMDEHRVAAMSAALLSLGQRASAGLGRGALAQVYVEGSEGTVFLVSAGMGAVLVAVGVPGAKAGLLMYEIRASAAAAARILEDVTGEPVRLILPLTTLPGAPMPGLTARPAPVAPFPAAEPSAVPVPDGDIFRALSLSSQEDPRDTPSDRGAQQPERDDDAFTAVDSIDVGSLEGVPAHPGPSAPHRP